MKTSRRSFLNAFMAHTLCTAASAESAAVERPMRIHKVDALGLEIWTEATPEWDTRLERLDEQSRFVAETPALAYPPAGMTWVSKPGSLFAEAELEEAARGVVHRVARNYGVREPSKLELTTARYGDLTGYRGDFSSPLRAMPVDVRVFLGHRPGRAAVVMQACTLKGKLGHIDEHIRRSWTNVRYL